VCGSFDGLSARQVRFLQEAARRGPLNVLLWSDHSVETLEGRPPEFLQAERKYFIEAIRCVERVDVVEVYDRDSLPDVDTVAGASWVVEEASHNERKQAFCAAAGLNYDVVREEALQGWPEWNVSQDEPSRLRKKVIVTGCFDWLHSGHVRFFEEVSQLGDLYVAVGHDENLRLLKGKGHPMFSQDQRCFMVQAVRYVRQAMITSGWGWMDAEPEIARLHPDIYAVNEDGDKPEKHSFCREHGLEYVVLKRTPKDGLPRRESTALRGY